MIGMGDVVETGQRGMAWQSDDTGGAGPGNSRKDRSTPGFIRHGQATGMGTTTSEDGYMVNDGDGPGRYTSGPNDGVRPRRYTCGRKNDGRSTGQAPSYSGSRRGDQNSRTTTQQDRQHGADGQQTSVGEAIAGDPMSTTRPVDRPRRNTRFRTGTRTLPCN